MTSLFPPRESLVRDILARDGNIEKLYFTVYSFSIAFLFQLDFPENFDAEEIEEMIRDEAEENSIISDL
jgi:hypothetical protein